MRLRSAEDKEYGLVCACTALKTKRRNQLALSGRREGIGICVVLREKEQELDVWSNEDKEWDRYALRRLSIPEARPKDRAQWQRTRILLL